MRASWIGVEEGEKEVEKTNPRAAQAQVFLITNLNRVRTVNGGVESEGINLVSPSNSSRRVSIARAASQGRTSLVALRKGIRSVRC